MSKIVWENKRANYMAKCNLGFWWEFSHKPVIQNGEWQSYELMAIWEKECIPYIEIEWQYSLIQRIYDDAVPEINNIKEEWPEVRIAQINEIEIILNKMARIKESRNFMEDVEYCMNKAKELKEEKIIRFLNKKAKSC